MSKPRYDWWGYVKSMIRKYPQRQRELDTMKRDTAGGMRPTERAVHKTLSKTAMREHAAVEAAIAITGRYRDGRERLKLIELVFWNKSHTLQGAAMKVNVSYRTAVRWHGEFVRLVASEFDLMD